MQKGMQLHFFFKNVQMIWKLCEFLVTFFIVFCFSIKNCLIGNGEG